MKKILGLVALLAALLVSACGGGGGASSAVTTVDAAEFLRAAAQPGVTVIDVRTPEEFAAGHLPGAVNINVEGADFDAQVAALSKDGAYAIYCRSGRRSTVAADKMAGTGFTRITNLDGGLVDLQNAGAQVVTS